ncbi:MAG: TRAM domain-containing protein [Clostridia bacterium]|nr:TRAM domain-containing protein [Clostridia bacterium]
MKSKTFHNLMRALVTLLGAGIGAALVALFVYIMDLTETPLDLAPGGLLLICIVTCLVFGGLLFLFSERIIEWFVSLGTGIVRHVDTIPVRRLLPSMSGMLVGLIVAALLSVIFTRLGDGIFITALTAILYLGLGVLGYTIGYRRSEELNSYVRRTVRMSSGKKLRTRRKARAAQQGGLKVIDTSALIDGRVADVSAAGFLEGTLVVPGFVVDELSRIAESPDPVRAAKGRRGMEILERLKQSRGEGYRSVTTDYPDTQDVDVKLLRLARDLGAAVIAGDYSLNRAAQVSDLKVLSIDALASALRPALVAGETVSLLIAREGKERGQGVGYLPDGTMVVVEGAHARVGETVSAEVSSVLQTSAGRMIFAKIAGAA